MRLLPWTSSGLLYRRISSDEALNAAWRVVRTGSDAAGSDGLTVSRFERDLFPQLKRLQRELQTRRYLPRPVKRFSLRKPSGGFRQIGLLAVRDRIVQRAVLTLVEPLFEAQFSAHSYAYRPNRSIEQAIDELLRLVRQGFIWAVDLDVDSYFDSVDLNGLRACIRKTIADRALRRLIDGWLFNEARSHGSSGRLIRRDHPMGILQGGILGPLWANVYLDRFDHWAEAQGLQVVRYADDMVILCRSRPEAKTALPRVTSQLRGLGLRVNPQKTRITLIPEGMDYLGQRVQAQPARRPSPAQAQMTTIAD